MTGNLHIAIVIGSLRTGGAERVMIRLANGFAKKNIRCSLVVLDDSGDMRKFVSPLVQIFSLNERHARNAIGKFRNFLKTNNPDALIISQTHIQLMTLLATKWEGWKGSVILNEHSLFSHNNKKWITKILAQNLFVRADAVTAVSKSVAKDFIGNFPSMEKKVSVIHNAAFDPEILKLKNAEIPFDDSLPMILAVGRLTRSKNYKLLIDAFKLSLTDKPARLVIVGDGEEREELERYVSEKEISSNVIFTGNVQNPYAYMARCSVFVMTSSYEGLPTVLIEALACGCNIVCTESEGGAREILMDGKLGTFIPPGDAYKLSRAINTKPGREISLSEKLTRAEDFNAGVAVDKYLMLINQLRNGS